MQEHAVSPRSHDQDTGMGYVSHTWPYPAFFWAMVRGPSCHTQSPLGFWIHLSEPRQLDLLQTLERLQLSGSVMVLTVTWRLQLMTEAHPVVPLGVLHVLPVETVYQSLPRSSLSPGLCWLVPQDDPPP